MHVLYLSHYFSPENNAPAARVHAMGREWVRAGHQVTVLTCAPNHPLGELYPGYRNRPWQEEWIDGIRTIRVWTYLAANRGTVRRSLNFLSYLASASLAAPFVHRPDVVIATSPQFFAGLAGVPAAAVHRAPFVLEIRDLWPESITTVGALERGLAVRALERLERWLYGRADRIVAVGEGYKDQLVARGVPAAKIDIVTNGVDTELFVPADADPAVRERLGIAPDAFVVIFAGTLGMAAGLEVVLRAAARLRDQGRGDVVFVLVGDGAERAGLERAAREAGLDAVRFTGMVPRDELPGAPRRERRLPRALPPQGALRQHPAVEVLRGRRHGEADPAGLRRTRTRAARRRRTAASPSRPRTMPAWRPRSNVSPPTRTRRGGWARTGAGMFWSASTGAHWLQTTSPSSNASPLRRETDELRRPGSRRAGV